MNGYGKMERRLRQQAEVLGGIEARLEVLERKLDGCARRDGGAGRPAGI